MKSYKALIIDDEPKLRKVLAIKLEQHCPMVSVVGLGSDISEGYDLIQKHQPDLIFLDISMPGGSGFDLLEKFKAINFEVIFVTGYNDYVLDALKASAVDYLLKPVITEDLISAVQKATIQLEQKEKVRLYNLLQHNLDNIGSQQTKVAIPGASAYDFVMVEDIIRCEGWQKYTKIFLSNDKPILSSYNIGIFKDMLERYGFYQTHKSHLINLQHILKYLKEGKVIMSNSDVVPVSRRKKEDFAEQVLKKRMLL